MEFEQEYTPMVEPKDTIYVLNEHGGLEEVEVPDDTDD